MLTLYVLSGPEIGKSCDLVDGSVLGRAPSCAKELAVVVRENSVSRSHARIERRGDRWFAIDLDSRNGLRFDGTRVAECELIDGTKFSLGDLELRIRLEQDATPKPRVVVAPVPAPVPEPPVADELDLEDEIELGDEIELEEEIDLTPRERVQPAPEPAPERPAPPSPRKGIPLGLREAAHRPDLGKTTMARTPAAQEPKVKQKVLQYHKVENRSGRFSTDMAQQSPLVRLIMIVVAVLIFGGIFFGAFKASQFMKSRTAGGPDVNGVNGGDELNEE